MTGGAQPAGGPWIADSVIGDPPDQAESVTGRSAAAAAEVATGSDRSSRRSGRETAVAAPRGQRWRAVALAGFPGSSPLRGRELVAVTAVSVLFVAACYPLLLGWRAFPAAADLLWAEDGAVFIRDALAMPYSSAVLEPYSGYAHLVPRTIAAVVTLLPPADWPLLVALASITVRALLAVFVWHATSGALPSRLGRAAISVAVVTLPLGGFEVLNNLANLQWFLIFACLPALLWRPSSVFGIAVQCVVVFAAVLSGPLALLWFPLALLRCITLRGIREWAVSVAFVAAALVQIAVALSTTRPRQGGWQLLDLAVAYVVRVAQTSFAGVVVPEAGWESARLAGLICTVVLLGAVLVAGVCLTGPHRALLVLSAVGSVVIYGAAVAISVPPEQMTRHLGSVSVIYAGRYAVTAGLLLLTAVVAALWAIARHAGRALPVVIAGVVALAALYVNGVLSGYPNQTYPPADQPWPEAVASATVECADPALATVTVPVDPGGWTAILVCEPFRSGS